MSNPEPTSPASLSGPFRKTLRARGNRLKPFLQIGRGGPNDHNRQLLAVEFDRADLVKVRVHTDAAEDADRVGQELANALRCTVVSRTGKVLLLYKPADSDKST
jgi:RNA-binding protein YhbY